MVTEAIRRELSSSREPVHQPHRQQAAPGSPQALVINSRIMTGNPGTTWATVGTCELGLGVAQADVGLGAGDGGAALGGVLQRGLVRLRQLLARAVVVQPRGLRLADAALRR